MVYYTIKERIRKAQAGGWDESISYPKTGTVFRFNAEAEWRRLSGFPLLPPSTLALGSTPPFRPFPKTRQVLYSKFLPSTVPGIKNSVQDRVATLQISR